MGVHRRMEVQMETSRKEELLKALNSFSDGGLYEMIECLPEEEWTENLLSVQDKIEELEIAIGFAILELEENL